MSDYISRADAMGAVQDHFNANGFKGYDDGQKMMDRINALPSADAVNREQYDFVCEEYNRLVHNAICIKLCDENCEYEKGKTCYHAQEHYAVDSVLSAEADRPSGEWTYRKGKAMNNKVKVCDKAESEYLDKTFPHEEKGTWYDLTEMITQCDVVDKCEECPRYADDCDGDKRIEPTDAVPQMEHDREWIIGCIKHDGFIKTDRFDKANNIIVDALESCDRPSGEWLEIEDYNGDYYYQCSVCKEDFYIEYGTPKENGYAYCPSCGARMYKGGAE